mmetsp:Transcript_52925/g.148510  ORF Transcript_52925/g.148510 Transcript_52925/m.148510 type:complete len:241 (-) Transcript_52925:32-754(-)
MNNEFKPIMTATRDSHQEDSSILESRVFLMGSRSWDHHTAPLSNDTSTDLIQSPLALAMSCIVCNAISSMVTSLLCRARFPTRGRRGGASASTGSGTEGASALGTSHETPARSEVVGAVFSCDASGGSGFRKSAANAAPPPLGSAFHCAAKNSASCSCATSSTASFAEASGQATFMRSCSCAARCRSKASCTSTHVRCHSDHISGMHRMLLVKLEGGNCAGDDMHAMAVDTFASSAQRTG